MTLHRLSFDFRQIADMSAFYRHFVRLTHSGAHFGNNLDALWDVLTGEMPLPAEIALCHLHSAARQETFAALIALLREAEVELAGQLNVRID
ncbi:barstar family protein [Duffyella gerundensis]|uniref:barstar family protein n=1 Tax=Duffyella TaxID=3026546 RepID=UPI003F6E1429